MNSDTASLRRNLEQRFSDQELTALCFDYFPSVHNQFTVGMTKGNKIQLLLDYCQRQDQILKLQKLISLDPPPPNSTVSKLRYIILSLIGIVLVISVASCAIKQLSPNNESSTDVAIRVADSRNVALSGASVTLLFDGNSAEEKTDSLGISSFNISHDGTVEVIVIIEKEGFEVHQTRFIVPEKRDLSVPLTEEEDDSANVIFRVVNDADHHPVVGAEIILLVEGEVYPNGTDSNGIVVFPLRFPDGKLGAELQIQTADFEILGENITLLPNRVYTVRLKPDTNQFEFVEP